ncbi:hypothetical protein SO694_00047156 [Aureococcus anophagefferens]|uniref:CAP-Gly domain-containing protein n=1 Tax=Aureococcus anophagefferens TaxID=44056 RepID=A0ABR1G817_AURAN
MAGEPGGVAASTPRRATTSTTGAPPLSEEAVAAKRRAALEFSREKSRRATALLAAQRRATAAASPSYAFGSKTRTPPDARRPRATNGHKGRTYQEILSGGGGRDDGGRRRREARRRVDAEADEAHVVRELYAGARVDVFDRKGRPRRLDCGRLRYLGPTTFSSGRQVWCGIELDMAFGAHDGEVEGTRYFGPTAALSGLMVPAELVKARARARGRKRTFLDFVVETLCARGERGALGFAAPFARGDVVVAARRGAARLDAGKRVTLSDDDSGDESCGGFEDDDYNSSNSDDDDGDDDDDDDAEAARARAPRRAAAARAARWLPGAFLARDNGTRDDGSGSVESSRSWASSAKSGQNPGGVANGSTFLSRMRQQPRRKVRAYVRPPCSWRPRRASPRRSSPAPTASARPTAPSPRASSGRATCSRTGPSASRAARDVEAQLEAKRLEEQQRRLSGRRPPPSSYAYARPKPEPEKPPAREPKSACARARRPEDPLLVDPTDVKNPFFGFVERFLSLATPAMALFDAGDRRLAAAVAAASDLRARASKATRARAPKKQRSTAAKLFRSAETDDPRGALAAMFAARAAARRPPRAAREPPRAALSSGGRASLRKTAPKAAADIPAHLTFDARRAAGLALGADVEGLRRRRAPAALRVGDVVLTRFGAGVVEARRPAATAAAPRRVVVRCLGWRAKVELEKGDVGRPPCAVGTRLGPATLLNAARVGDGGGREVAVRVDGAAEPSTSRRGRAWRARAAPRASGGGRRPRARRPRPPGTAPRTTAPRTTRSDRSDRGSDPPSRRASRASNDDSSDVSDIEALGSFLEI